MTLCCSRILIRCVVLGACSSREWELRWDSRMLYWGWMILEVSLRAYGGYGSEGADAVRAGWTLHSHVQKSIDIYVNQFTYDEVSKVACFLLEAWRAS